MGGSREGGQGVRTPARKNHKNIGFLNNTGPDSLKNHKSYQASIQNLANWPTSETQWSFVGVPIMASVLGSSIPSSTRKKKKIGPL